MKKFTLDLYLWLEQNRPGWTSFRLVVNYEPSPFEITSSKGWICSETEDGFESEGIRPNHIRKEFNNFIAPYLPPTSNHLVLELSQDRTFEISFHTLKKQHILKEEYISTQTLNHIQTDILDPLELQAGGDQ